MALPRAMLHLRECNLHLDRSHQRRRADKSDELYILLPIYLSFKLDKVIARPVCDRCVACSWRAVVLPLGERDGVLRGLPIVAGIAQRSAERFSDGEMRIVKVQTPPKFLF